MAAPADLIVAAGAGDLRRVKALVRRDPGAARHWKPIMDAAFHGHPQVVEALIGAGADPNAVSGTASRDRPLTRCLAYRKTIAKGPGHPQVVRVLAKHGADLDAPGGGRSWTPLGHAARGGRRDLAELLIELGATVDVFAAAILYDVRRLRALLRGDARRADATDSIGRTPLHWVAASGMWRAPDRDARRACETAQILLDAGADVNASFDDGGIARSPLWWAVEWEKNAELARFLLERGASARGGMASAAFTGDELCELLLAHGAGVDERGPDGRTPLLSILYFGAPGQAPWLLEHGADPNAQDSEGRTPLHVAARRGLRPSVLELLLHHGARIDARDHRGDTPLAAARGAGKRRQADLLKARGARGG